MTDFSTASRKSKLRQILSSTFSFLRHSEKRSNSAFLVVAVVAFLIPWVASKGLDVVWSAIAGDPTEEFVDKIKTETDAIKESVADVSEALKNVKANIPEEQYSAIIGMLQGIDAKAASIEPTAVRLASATKDYVNGALVSDGPYNDNGSFFIETTAAGVGLAKQICGTSTVSYDPDDPFRKVSLSVNGRTVGGNADGRSIKNGDVWVTVSPSAKAATTLQIFYSCTSEA